MEIAVSNLDVVEAVKTKVCKKCEQELPLSAFGKYVYKHKGKNERKYHGSCKKCSIPTPSNEVINSRLSLITPNGMHRCVVCKCDCDNSRFAIRRTGPYAGNLVNTCFDCHRKNMEVWRAENPEKVVASSRKNYLNHRDTILTDENRAKRNAWSKIWAKNHPDKPTAVGASRRARKLKATPQWSNKTVIDTVYKNSSLWSGILGVKMSVDHVVPLKSAYVCGLHSEDNLQVLHLPLNVQKGNRDWPDMWDMTPELKQLAKEFKKQNVKDN